MRLKTLLITVLLLSTSFFAMAEDSKFTIKRDEMDTQMKDFNKTLTQSRTVPEMRNGQVVGFKMVKMPKGKKSFYDRMELKENETITNINETQPSN